MTRIWNRKVFEKESRSVSSLQSGGDKPKATIVEMVCQRFERRKGIKFRNKIDCFDKRILKFSLYI